MIKIIAVIIVIGLFILFLNKAEKFRNKERDIYGKL